MKTNSNKSYYNSKSSEQSEIAKVKMWRRQFASMFYTSFCRSIKEYITYKYYYSESQSIAPNKSINVTCKTTHLGGHSDVPTIQPAVLI